MKKEVISSGFTLIELLIVFSLIGTLIVATLATFRTYNQTQSFQTSVSDVSQLLKTARSRALTQVKPTQCGVQQLKKYQVAFTAPGSAYQLEVVCGNTTYILTQKSLSSPTTFANGTMSRAVFIVSVGTAETSGSIIITGNGQSKTIVVDGAGNIKVN